MRSLKELYAKGLIADKSVHQRDELEDSETSNMPNNDHKPQILIVDDEPSNIRMLSAGLRENYEISVATDGHQAIEFAEKNAATLDLILLDIVMPGLSGYNVCSAIKRNKETKNIPIIFITAKTTPESEAKGFELGAVDYIAKPFNLPVVQARVDTHATLKAHSDLLKKLVSEQSAKVRKYEKEYKRLFKK